MPMQGITTERKCAAISRRSGERCNNFAVTGNRVCRMHGGSTPAVVERANQIKAERKMARFVTPISSGDPEADILQGFAVEYRRCVGRIRYYDEKILELDYDHDLIWGRTKREDKGATEFEGVDTTYEARRHMWLQLQDDERKILREMSKIWISAKLDIRKLEIEEEKVVAIEGVLSRVLTALGINVQSPETREVIHRELLSLPMKG